MELSRIIFGDYAFQKLDYDNKIKKPINRSLFEVWSVEFAKLTQEKRNKLISNKNLVYNQFQDLFKQHNENDDQEKKLFYKSISSATNQKERVIHRFKIIHEMIQKVLNV